MTDKPNILFFFADDQRFDTINALGNPEILTPNLDMLVKNGTTFTQAHIPGGTVGAVCMPSRAMLNTGRTLFHLFNDGEEIPEDHVLMGETFKKSGYRTFGTGKWHNGTGSYARSFTDGGEIFFGGMNDHWNVPSCDFDPEGKYNKESRYIDNFKFRNNVNQRICDHIHCGRHSTELFCDCAIKWLENYSDNNPFYMYISFMAPHDPRSMPEEFLKMYDPDKIPIPENFLTRHPFEFGIEDIRDELLATFPRTESEIRKHIHEYYAMITHLDHEMGKVIKALKKAGKYDNTIIIFASDNGLALGQHGLMGKQSCYEHSVRVPLIFAGPGIPKNERRDAYVYLMDIFPTLCDLAGINIPETVEGKSLLPVIKDKNREVRGTLYFAYESLCRAVKDDRYKLIEYRKEGVSETQLFDLRNDPKEMNNLYGISGYEQVMAKLTGELLKYCEEWGDRQHPCGEMFWSRYNINT